MLNDFVSNLFKGRPVHIGPPTHPNEGDVLESLQKILAFEQDWRVELPGDPPKLDIDAVRWSITSLYLASSLVIHRDTNAEEIDQLLCAPPPDRSLVESHYAVDLTMRYLPDLLRLAKSASNDDPLVVRLLDWARMWPLSSVGVKDIGHVDVAPLRTSATLMRLYVDRIVASDDIGRLNDPAVSNLAAALLGDYPELNSKVAHFINPEPCLSEISLSKNDTLDS